MRGWRDLARGVLAESKEDRITLLAAGVAFYGLLSLLPALLAVVSIYGLVADPDQVEHQITSATRALPPDASHLLATQLHDLVATASTQGLGVRTAISIVVALWSASAGIKHLIDAVNVAYEEDESRSYVHVRAIALVLTVGAALFIVAAAALLAFLPALLSHVSLGAPARVLVSVIRFPLLAAAMMAGLSIVYRYGPDRTIRRSGWVSWGAGVAMVVWLVASGGPGALRLAGRAHQPHLRLARRGDRAHAVAAAHRPGGHPRCRGQRRARGLRLYEAGTGWRSPWMTRVEPARARATPSPISATVTRIGVASEDEPKNRGAVPAIDVHQTTVAVSTTTAQAATPRASAPSNLSTRGGARAGRRRRR